MPNVRVGANSEDKTQFNSAVNVIQETFPAPSATQPYPEASSITVSDAYYQLSKWMPSGTHMTWGLNLGANSASIAVAQAKSIMAAFASADVKNAGVILDNFEIGNEPDLYSNNGLRSGTWNLDTYIGQWTAIASQVASATGMKQGSTPGFLAASFAGSSSSGFSPTNFINRGVLKSSPGNLITTISQHHYSGSFCQGNGGLLQNLMAKSGIRGNVTIYNNDISTTYGNGLVYILGETNSYACHGAPGVSNTAGAALWAIDYALQAASRSVRVMNFHDGVGYRYNLIQPIALTKSIIDGHDMASLAPHVQGQYYGAIAVADFIGSATSQGIPTNIVELSISNTWIAGYAMYEGGKVARVILVNSLAYFSGTRSSVTVSLNVSGGTVGSGRMKVKRLAITTADATTGLKWGGQTYETSDGLVGGSLVLDDSAVSEGVVVSATEAVMLSFY